MILQAGSCPPVGSSALVSAGISEVVTLQGSLFAVLRPVTVPLVGLRLLQGVTVDDINPALPSGP